MNILLANMPINFNKKENLEPPLGISYMGAVLRDRGHKVFLKDYEVEYFSGCEALQFIEDNKIKIVSISFRTASYRSAKVFIESLKKIKDRIFIVIGGHHATAFSKDTMIDLSCDAVVRGEGEETIRELVDAVENNRTLKDIKGLTYRTRDDIIHNEDRMPISDLDSLPFPMRDALPYDSYTLATIITSRGCPFGCIYCDKGISTKKVHYRSPENIMAEIKYITDRFKKHRLYIVDDHFFLKKNRTHTILDNIINSGIKIKWVCQARADGVDEEILRKAKRSGCEQIMYGLETGDKMELEYIKKQTTLEQAEKAVNLTRKAGIRARTNFMLGFPESTHESIRNTIRFAAKIRPDVVRFFAVTPLPNTELWENIYGKNSNVSGIDWGSFDFYNMNFETKYLKKEEVSLYVLAGYWHVLKKRFLLEITIFFPFNIIRLLFKVMVTGRLRGNVSLYFPASINLIRDTAPQVLKKRLKDSLRLISRAMELEKKI